MDLLNSTMNQIPNLVNMDMVEYVPSQNNILSLHSEYYLAFHDLDTGKHIIKTIEIQDDAYLYLA